MPCPPIPYPYIQGLDAETQRQINRNFQHLVEQGCGGGGECPPPVPWTPMPPLPGTASSSPDSAIISTSINKGFAWIFPAPYSGDINGISIYLTAVGNQPDNGLKASIQTVSATTGLPSGVVQSQTIAPNFTAGAWKDFTILSGTVTVTRGDMIAVTIEIVSPVAGDSVGLGARWSGINQNQLEYQATLNTGTGNWSKLSGSTVDYLGLALVRYSIDGSNVWSPANPLLYHGIPEQVSFNSGSTPDEMGLKFSFAEGITISGWQAAGIPAADFDVVLYDSTDAVVASVSVDKDQVHNLSNNGLLGWWDADIVLAAAEDYRLVLKPTSVTNIQHTIITVAASDRVFPSVLSTWKYTTRTNAGAWTDDATKRSLILPIRAEGST